MVRISELTGRTAHFCEICSLAYAEPALAEACEAWCKSHPTCSLEIGRKAVGSVQGSEGEP